jgi:hypothetical protein
MSFSPKEEEEKKRKIKNIVVWIVIGIFLLILLYIILRKFYKTYRVAEINMRGFASSESSLQREKLKLNMIYNDGTPLTCDYNYKGIIKGCNDINGNYKVNLYAEKQTKSAEIPFL